MQRVLAFISSRVGNSGFLEMAIPQVQQFLGDRQLTIAFIPFASVAKDYDEYGLMVEAALEKSPYSIIIVKPFNAVEAIENADVIMVGGGNTFKLLHDIYELKLFHLIQQKVHAGTPYIGWSAGSNLTGLTISTTNDMPIIEPESFKAFGFLPFQINPHYFSQPIDGHNGETRDQRLNEFLQIHPAIPIVALPEGTSLLLDAGKLTLTGTRPAIVFHEAQKKEIASGTALDFLMKPL